MSDIDYDQLDKAVINAMTDAPIVQPVKNTTNISSSASPDSNAPSAAIKNRSQDLQRAQVSFASTGRKPGRFMDMVSPAMARRPVMERQIPKMSQSEADERRVEADEPTFSPLTVRPRQNVNESIGDLAESPFIANAKVEKRPLGANSPDDSFSHSPAVANKLEATPLKSVKKIPFIKAGKTKLRIDPQLQLESEYDDAPFDELIASVANSVVPAAAPASTVASAVPAVTPMRAAVPAPEVSPNKPVASTKPVATVAPSPSAAVQVSIPQQYKEQVSAPQYNGAVYDTEEYHRPFAHKYEKHSNLWAVLWVFLLVIVGAGIGAIAYFFLLPLL